MSVDHCGKPQEAQSHSPLDCSLSTEQDENRSVTSATQFPRVQSPTGLELPSSPMSHSAVTQTSTDRAESSSLEFTGRFGCEGRVLRTGDCMHCAELEDQYRSMERLMFTWKEAAKDARTELAAYKQELDLARRERTEWARGMEEYRKKYESLLEKYIELMSSRGSEVPATHRKAGSRVESDVRRRENSHRTSVSLERSDTDSRSKSRGKSPLTAEQHRYLANSATEWQARLREVDSCTTAEKRKKGKSAADVIEDRIRGRVLKAVKEKSSQG